jgi:hypothetical protein
MEVDSTPPENASSARETVPSVLYSRRTILTVVQAAPFLVRTFVKIGSFHRLSLFEDGSLPTTDEQQLFTW